MRWVGRKRYALGAAIVLGALAVFVVLYTWWPWWIDGARLRRAGLSTQDQSGILSGDRGDVLKIIAGAGAVVALVYTARKHALDRQAHALDLEAQKLSRQVYALSEQGQVTDRYTKAITQLASDKASERIGGIYALERIMADSERDHPTVVEVLAAFVRQRAPLPASEPGQAAAHQGSGSEAPRPEADVQAAMTVLARRPEREEPFAIDLRRTALAGLELPPGARLDGANLRGSNLTRANLDGVMLTGAILAEATLNKANLQWATLTGATMWEATLTEAHLLETTLTEANLWQATLTGAYFVGATLTGARLQGATLTGANLWRATLTEAYGLEASQLGGCVLMDTVLDEALAGDAWVLARIEACKGWSWSDAVPAPTPNPAEQSSGS